MRTLLFAAMLCFAAAAAAGQFNNECAYGLSLGMHVKTDCSVNTRIDGKTYCFSSGESRSRFMADAAGNLKKAQQVAEKDKK
jgi:YHS domain-containing protein